MEAVFLGNNQFSLRGTCPYPNCSRSSVFVTLISSQVGSRAVNGVLCTGFVAIMQCQGCQNYILARLEQPQNSTNTYFYREHYPTGAPNQAVADEIPEHIKEDFKEALRCIFVDAYNATVEMCRRALEASCLDLGAPKDKVLEKMIDWLEQERIITPYLKNAAHNVRLGGNRGAHPPVDGPPLTQDVVPVENAPVERIEREHAEAIVAFTSEFFHHVYVGPKMLGKFNFTKPKAAKV